MSMLLAGHPGGGTFRWRDIPASRKLVTSPQILTAGPGGFCLRSRLLPDMGPPTPVRRVLHLVDGARAARRAAAGAGAGGQDRPQATVVMWTRVRRHQRTTLTQDHGLPRPVRQAAHPPARRFITWTALAMMTVGSVGYLGSAPAMSVFGLASVFFYVLPALLFLLPVSLVAAELASGWPGGVYNWVCEGISAPLGLVAVWCEFAQTIFYYHGLVAYVAGTLAYVIDPRLAGNGVYNAVVIIVLFWGGVLVSARGVTLVSELSSSGTVVGTLIPGAILVVLGVAYLAQGNPSAAPMATSHLLPAWTGVAGIVLVVNSFFTYAGIEVNAVHVDELKNPGRDYPKSIFLAMALVLAVFILPTLAISWV